jgi:hypothetical protein
MHRFVEYFQWNPEIAFSPAQALSVMAVPTNCADAKAFRSDVFGSVAGACLTFARSDGG